MDSQDVMAQLDELPILEVARHFAGLQAREAEAEHRNYPCPFHDDRNGSLHFYTRSNRYKCFGCGASGGLAAGRCIPGGGESAPAARGAGAAAAGAAATGHGASAPGAAEGRARLGQGTRTRGAGAD